MLACMKHSTRGCLVHGKYNILLAMPYVELNTQHSSCAVLFIYTCGSTLLNYNIMLMTL